METRVLILGGTEDGLRLHEQLKAKGITATLSLAGRTNSPASLPLGSRVGGFGGAAGLATYLRQNEISALVDATHPFAAQISRNASTAALETNTPLLRLSRPAWSPTKADTWVNVVNETEAAQALPAGAKVFLALGAQKLSPFAERRDVEFVVRVVDVPASPLLPFAHEVVTDRGPFVLATEQELLVRHGISHIVARNSGGVGAVAKIDAARILGIPVVMIARPEFGEAERRHTTVAKADDACAWVIDRLG